MITFVIKTFPLSEPFTQIYFIWFVFFLLVLSTVNSLNSLVIYQTYPLLRAKMLSFVVRSLIQERIRLSGLSKQILFLLFFVDHFYESDFCLYETAQKWPFSSNESNKNLIFQNLFSSSSSVDSQQLISIQEHVIENKNGRISIQVVGDSFDTLFELRINNISLDDRGYYMCQIQCLDTVQTCTPKSQVGYVNVVGKFFVCLMVYLF